MPFRPGQLDFSEKVIYWRHTLRVLWASGRNSIRSLPFSGVGFCDGYQASDFGKDTIGMELMKRMV